jgi:hypothetical protein
MPLIVKLVEKKVRDKRKGKTYTSKMVTIPKPLVKAWGDVDFVMMEMDRKGRLVITPLPTGVAKEYVEKGRRVEV